MCCLVSQATSSAPTVSKVLGDAHQSLVLNSTKSAEGRIAISGHDPNINFIDTAAAGYANARRVSCDARPVKVVGYWPFRQQDSPRYPNLRLYVTAPTRNFSLKSAAPTYGLWGPPEDWPTEQHGLSRSWDWIFLSMDLPEAWQIVQEAGWDRPLDCFAVNRGWHGGFFELFYQFWARDEEMDRVFVGVQSKKVVEGESRDIDPVQISQGSLDVDEKVL